VIELLTNISDLPRIEHIQEFDHLSPQNIHVHTLTGVFGHCFEVGDQTEGVWNGIEGWVDDLTTNVRTF
tara:strand:- start:535 stop:741 length:207 start_codon:yes stop_codon:yes gene_type:complete